MASVEVEYWQLAEAIRQVPEVKEVTGRVGRQNSFEISVNGQLIYSKLKTGKIPPPDESLLFTMRV
ncbi:hypothetical protein NQZ68_038520 [Dissostichus eleginoides]|nr:hypothetical protein NQZ68_038520 [Dissostichus eleginoides]